MYVRLTPSFKTLQSLQDVSIPECHKLQFLQMACEKLVKAHLCGSGTDPAALQASHAYVAKTLPVVLRQQASAVNFVGGKARKALTYARHLAQEIEVLAPAVDRGGRRPDNCEYPWEADDGKTALAPGMVLPALATHRSARRSNHSQTDPRGYQTACWNRVDTTPRLLPWASAGACRMLSVESPIRWSSTWLSENRGG